MIAMLPFLGPVERLILVRDGYYHADARTRRRAAMILAMDRGESPTAVARSSRCNRATVYYWVNRYLQHRDPSCLTPGQSLDVCSRAFRCARDLNDFKVQKLGKLGRLRWNSRAKGMLKMDAKIAPDPRKRLEAAILWALDRGVPVRHVAHLAQQSRTNIYRTLKRAHCLGSVAKTAGPR